MALYKEQKQTLWESRLKETELNVSKFTENSISSLAHYLALKENNSEILKITSKYYNSNIYDTFSSEYNEFVDSDYINYVIEALQSNDSFYNIISSYELSELVFKLLKINGGDIIYDLGCGNGTFLANAIKYAYQNKIVLKGLVGIEINSKQSEIAYLVSYILTRVYQTQFDIYNKDAINGKCDFPYTHAYVMPPFGAKSISLVSLPHSKIFDYKFTNKNRTEWLYVDSMLQSLGKYLHKAAAVLPMSALFDKGDFEYRSQLIKHGYIEHIIGLPLGTISMSNVKCALVIFSTENHGVKFSDVSKDIDLFKFGKQKLPVEKIVNLIESDKTIFIDNFSLINMNSLDPSTLILSGSVPTIENGIKLSEAAEVFTGCQYTVKNFSDMFTPEKTNYQILTSSDINNGVVDWNSLQYIDYKDNKFDKYALRESDLIITSKSTKVKLAVVDINPDRKILVTGGMIIVRPNIEKLNPTFLKMFLETENGQKAMQLIQKGTTIKSMLAKDVAEIVVPNVPIEKQRDMAEKYNFKLSTLIAYKKEIEILENKLSNFFNEELEGDE